MAALGGMIGMMVLAISTTGALSDMFLVLAGALMLVSMANNFKWMIEKLGPAVGIPAAILLGGVMLAGLFAFREKMQGFMKGVGAGGSISTAAVKVPTLPTERMYDSGGMFTGGRMYDTGGPTTEHGMAVLQKGETVIPKTRNMLEGGITLNIGGDIITDNAEDFAERIAQVLPEALRRQSDAGGI
jgi:hypothetical protein